MKKRNKDFGTIGKNNGKSSFVEDNLSDGYLKKTMLEKFSPYRFVQRYFTDKTENKSEEK